MATTGAMRVPVHGIPEEIPSGLWCYRIDRSRSLLGRAVNDVGRVVNWLESTVQLSPVDDGNLILAAAPQPGGQRTGSPRRSFGSHNRGSSCMERWKASRSLTPGSPISFNRWPASRKGSWRAGG